LPTGAIGTSSSSNIFVSYDSLMAESGYIRVRACFDFGESSELKLPIRVVASCGIDEIPKINLPDKFKIYPNPTKGLVNIERDISVQDDFSIEVLNSAGKVVSPSFKTTTESTQIDLTRFPSGIYLIKLNLKLESLIIRIIKE
jgi:hypothetical protein